MNRGRKAAAVLGVLVVGACGSGGSSSSGPVGINRINHVIVIYQENWSFDSLYGTFPGANGLQNIKSVVQVDKNGKPYDVLPQPLDTTKSMAGVAPPDTRFPANLPVAPFDAAKYVAPTQTTGDLVHRFYQEQFQMDGGRMDKFIAWTDAGGLVMSYYDGTNLPEGKLAQKYVLADRFFHAAYGGSFINHFWAICACTPRFDNAPAAIRAQLDPSGALTKDGAVTPDGYAVNTLFSVNTPHPAPEKAPNAVFGQQGGTDPSQLLPNQTMPNIGDRLSAANLDWAWYAGGFDNALSGHPDPLFQNHHQPFVYFSTTADGTQAKKDHLRDETRFMSDLNNGKLPAVSYVKPIGTDNEHPGYTAEMPGQKHVADIVAAVQKSKYWKDTAIFITYDENGGRWDHQPPTRADQWGPGTRVPAIIISPYSKQHFVDDTAYDTTSILAFIEHRWNLKPLAVRDAQVNDLTNAFDFTQSPHD